MSDERRAPVPGTPTHRAMFPEQYAHALVGRTVEVRRVDGGDLTTGGPVMVVLHRGEVARVVESRFGALAIFADTDVAYPVMSCYAVTL